MTFAEYLKSKGADDATITAMDTPLAREVYEQMNARAAEAETLKTNMKAYETKVGEYYETTKAQADKRDRELILSRAEAARTRAALLAAQEQGLIDVAKDLNLKLDEPAKTPADAPNYLTLDAVKPYLESAGDGLAAVIDATAEHSRLFPERPFNARQIRLEAVAANKPFYQYWEEKFGVRQARDAYETKQREAYELKLRKEGADAERAKFASEYGNPMTRPATPSNSPFFSRKTDDGKPRQPWAASEDENSNARVRRATENFIKRGEEAAN